MRRSEADIGSRRTDSPLRTARSAALAVAGGVDGDPLAVRLALEGGPVADQLQGIEGLAAAADQDAEVVLAVDVGEDLLVGLGHLDVGVEVELVEDPLEDHPDA